jgi:hypothetical protein
MSCPTDPNIKKPTHNTHVLSIRTQFTPGQTRALHQNAPLLHHEMTLLHSVSPRLHTHETARAVQSVPPRPREGEGAVGIKGTHGRESRG